MFLPSNITLQFGDSGDFVAELQRRLAAVGLHDEALVNGFFDGATTGSVTAFQTRIGIRADGVAGPETLRRLNGALSGSGSTDTKKNEEEQAANAALTSQYQLMDNPALTPAAPISLGEAALGAGAAVAVGSMFQEAAPAHGAATASPTSLAPDVAQIQQQLQQQAQMNQQLQQQQMQQPAPQPSQGDALANMLLQQQQHAQQQAVLAQQQPQHVPQQQASTQQNPAQQQPQAAAQDNANAQVPAEAQQRQGIVGRAMQKMDAMLQKLNDYFEAKLPPDVLREVKQVGVVMAQSGVRESAIPGGPDMGVAQPTPARGPDQQQIPQR